MWFNLCLCACLCVVSYSLYILSCCFLAWRDALKHSVVCGCKCMLRVRACIAISVNSVRIKAGGILIHSEVKQPMRTGTYFLSIEAQNLHLDPDWVKQSSTLHPTWKPALSESRGNHYRQSQPSFSSAMQWQTGTVLINSKVFNCWDCGQGVD